MRTLLKNALVLDTDHLYERLDVLVDGDGIIEKIAPDIPADGAAVVNLAGCTLLPGIIDAHVHVSNGGPLSAQVLKNWAKSGVTTVRDLGLMTPMAVEDYMAFLHEHEGPEYPRVLSTGKYVDIPGGYGSGPNPNEVIGLLTEDPAQAAAYVKMQAGLGAKVVKIGLSEGPGPGGAIAVPMGDEMLTAIRDTAHACGLPITAHVLDCKNFRRLVDAGIDDMAHTPADGLIPDEVIAAGVGKGIPMTGTIGDPDAPPPGDAPEEFVKLMQEIGPKRRATILENMMRWHRAGGMLVLGSDNFGREDDPASTAIPAYELRQMAEKGFAFMEILRTATINAAKVCRTDGEEGSVTVGKRANLIALRGRVAEDFSNLRAPGFVMNRGVILKNEL